MNNHMRNADGASDDDKPFVGVVRLHPGLGIITIEPAQGPTERVTLRGTYHDATAVLNKKSIIAITGPADDEQSIADARLFATNRRTLTALRRITAALVDASHSVLNTEQWVVAMQLVAEAEAVIREAAEDV